jgi:transcriptional regulator with XRE-family HTH domain
MKSGQRKAANEMKSGSTKSDTKIARLRCERGLTQAALAKGTGVNIRTIQKFDSGERGIETASLAVALRIADFLGVEPRDLI